MALENEVVTAAVAKYASPVTLSGGGIAVLGYLTTTEALAVAGFFLAAISFVVDMILKRRKYLRENAEEKMSIDLYRQEETRKDEEHSMKMQLLRKELAQKK